MLPPPAAPSAEEINPPEVRAELDRLLASHAFARSRRSSRLLRFVVEKAISGTARSLNEYAIGLEVFDRNAADYNPGDDPIVRVQVGRLREKLHQHYSSGADSPAIRFEIPVGTYMPVFRRASAKPERSETGKLMILSIKGITTDEAAAQFALGLREELVHHMFQAFGNIVVPPATGDGLRLADAAEEQGVGYALEGSVRLEGGHVRASLRLVEARNGCLAWSAQFDREIGSAIDAQEALAKEICAALKAHMANAESQR